MILPLALAQFICSYAASSMNVAISSIASSLATSVHGVQIAITLFTLIMAAFMIPGSKLTDIWGRKKCFIIGLIIYGTGALIATFAGSLTTMIIGYSILEGLGSALLIPPIYILVTVSFTDIKSRAKYFGIISGMAGLGAAAGPLIGGVLTSWISWRAAFLVQALIVLGIIFLTKRIVDAGVQGAKPHFDIFGTILSASGLVAIVSGILQAGTYGWFSLQVWSFVGIGAALLAWYAYYANSLEKKGKQPLFSMRLFANKVSNRGLLTQLIQWLTLQGGFFVISVYLQTIRGYSAVQTGLILTASTVGLLLASARAGKMANRFSQAALIRGGFLFTIAGMILILLSYFLAQPGWIFIPGLFFIGAGIGIMLTASVNVVQSSFAEKDQGEISGVSRSVSNLGSSLGTAIVGAVLISAVASVDKTFGLALLTMIGIGLIGFITALFIPNRPINPSS